MSRFLDLIMGPGWVVLLLLNFLMMNTLGTISETIRESVQTNSTTEPSPKYNNDSVPNNSTDNVPKTSTEPVPTTSIKPVPKTTPCKVLVGIDEPLYDHFSKNMTKIVDSVNYHFQQINQIFNQKVFTGDLGGIYFKVSRIQVMFGSCDAIKYKNCTHQIDEFLEIFDQYDFQEFCLAYMFTFRDFHDGTAGLATMSGLCDKEQNSGFITFLNYNLTSDINETVDNLAHELGHSLGAHHDDEVKMVDSVVEECNVRKKDCGCGTGFIMEAEGFHDDPTSRQFTECSVASIQDTIHAVMASESNCLLEEKETKELETALCGNNIVEPGEECDCGDDQMSCNDPCCYPAHISAGEREFNQSALPCSRTSRVRCGAVQTNSTTEPVPKYKNDSVPNNSTDNVPKTSTEPVPKTTSYFNSLVYGVYLPMAFILAAVLLTGFLLLHDWTREKKLFTHITKRNVKIVSKRQNTRMAGEKQGPLCV